MWLIKIRPTGQTILLPAGSACPSLPLLPTGDSPSQVPPILSVFISPSVCYVGGGELGLSSYDFFFSLKGCWLWTQLGEINYRQWPCPSGTAPPDRVPIRPSPSTTTTYRITKEPAADQDRRKWHQTLEQNGFELQIEFQPLPMGRFLSFVSKPTVKEALFCSWWRTRLSLNF